MEREHAKNPARAIYGTILVMAVISALSEDDAIGAAELVGWVLATALVFWIAHVYAEVLGHRLEGEVGSILTGIRAGMASEWPLVEAILLPVIALLTAVVGIFDRDTAVDIAIGIGVVELFLWGVAAGRRLQMGVTGTIVIGAVNASFGLVVVALKVLIH